MQEPVFGGFPTKTGSCFAQEYPSSKLRFAAIITGKARCPDPMPKHLLLIDDDALLVRSLAYILEQAGYRTSTANNAQEGLASIEQDPPDLILLDIGLPDMDGLSMLRRIQKERDTPVIFLTARRRELDEVLGLELGAEDYITKPFSEDILLARIKIVLRRSERLERSLPGRRADRSRRPGDRPGGAHRHLRRPAGGTGAKGIRPAARPGVEQRASHVGERTCWNKCGALSISASRKSFTFTSAGCAKSWKMTLPSRGAS